MARTRSKRKRKRHARGPRRWRMKRPARLRAAPTFLEAYRGKHIVKGYAKWFRVDLGCALKELLKLGVEIDPVYVERLRTTLRERGRAGHERKDALRRQAELEQEAFEQELLLWEFDEWPWCVQPEPPWLEQDPQKEDALPF